MSLLATITVTDVLGNIKEVTRTYGDGSYDCPHCNNPIRADEGLGPCKNPWCIANPSMPVDAARALFEKAEAKRKEDEQRKRNHQLALERIENDRVTRNEAIAKAEQEATKKGQCLRCLRRSDYRKGIKHRGQCPLATQGPKEMAFR